MHGAVLGIGETEGTRGPSGPLCAQEGRPGLVSAGPPPGTGHSIGAHRTMHSLNDRVSLSVPARRGGNGPSSSAATWGPGNPSRRPALQHDEPGSPAPAARPSRLGQHRLG